MEVRIPERRKKAGVAYAVTHDGVELPVIDITHPAFMVAQTADDLAVLHARFRRDDRRQARIPIFLHRILLRPLVRQSVILRGLMLAAGRFLSGLNTYLMKLGPDNLGPGYAGPVDRRIAASLAGVDLRLRLENTAQLVAGGLSAILAARPGAPLVLVNIAGGPGADSLNALILLHHTDPVYLRGRPTRILILDLEDEAPEFGRRSLAALAAESFPLHGLDISLQFVRFNWTEPASLSTILDGISPGICAVSSEGGLFEYGSDAEVIANLSAIAAHAPDETFVVGSVTRENAFGARLHRWSRIPIRPRSASDFAALAARSGWRVDQVIERSLSRVVRLRKR